MIKLVHPADDVAAIYAEMGDKYGRPKDFSISFLPELDKKIWGLNRQRLAVVAGRTSNGKSVLLLQMAHTFAKQGKTVVFITLEMTRKTCIERIINNELSIDNWANIAGLNPEEFAKYAPGVARFKDELSQQRLVIIEGYGKTFKEIIRVLEELKADVDAVFIDYIQMIKNPSKEGIDEYIKDLRTMSIQKNLLSVIGSQINRSTYDGKRIKKPEMWELKGSGALEEICDICILVHWQHHYDLEDDNFHDYWIRVSKNRDGRTGAFDCRIDPQYSRIGEKDAGFIAGFGKCVGTADKSYEENVF